MSRETFSVGGDPPENEIGDNIWKGARARNFEMMRHGRDRFQAILELKERIKGFVQRGEDEYVWGYYDGIFLWHVVDRWHGARKWVWIFPSSKRR